MTTMPPQPDAPTETASSDVSAKPTPVWAQVVGNRRFLVAVGLLVVAIIGWHVSVWALGFALDKQPIAWPAGVTVNKDFVMTSFPEMFPAVAPRYILLSSKRLGDQAIPERDAITTLPEETRLELDVGKPSDAPRWADRKSNWYLSRKYGDLSQRDARDVRYWHLDVIYYTGSAELVAHVPGRCMVAAGATPLGDKVLTWKDLPPNALGWNQVKVVRSAFESVDAQGRQSHVVQYYTFSVNGHNEHDWKQVRWTLSSNIRQKYVYFGKIQFAPLAVNVEDLEAADKSAEQFFRAAAVEIFSKFPPAQTVNDLNQSSASS